MCVSILATQQRRWWSRHLWSQFICLARFYSSCGPATFIPKKEATHVVHVESKEKQITYLLAWGAEFRQLPSFSWLGNDSYSHVPRSKLSFMGQKKRPEPGHQLEIKLWVTLRKSTLHGDDYFWALPNLQCDNTAVLSHLSCKENKMLEIDTKVFVQCSFCAVNDRQV